MYCWKERSQPFHPDLSKIEIRQLWPQPRCRRLCRPPAFGLLSAKHSVCQDTLKQSCFPIHLLLWIFVLRQRQVSQVLFIFLLFLLFRQPGHPYGQLQGRVSFEFSLLLVLRRFSVKFPSDSFWSPDSPHLSCFPKTQYGCVPVISWLITHRTVV